MLQRSNTAFDDLAELPPKYASKPIVVAAVTGMLREAQIVAGHGLRAIACGGRPDVLKREFSRALDYSVCGIISVGICGALSPVLRPGDCIVASQVITGNNRIATDPEWTKRLRQSLPHAMDGAIAGSDVLLRTAAEKAAVFTRTGALAADMESHVAAETAQRRGIPFACLRCVADSANTDLPHAAIHALTEDGRVAVGAVIASVIARPYQLFALLRAGRDTKAALYSLLRCRRVLGACLAGPNFRKPALDMA
jgi:hopanoid-associated phosphorylase